jgi:spermidine/putrescine-binding protein
MFTFNKDNALEYMKYTIRSKRTRLFPELDMQFMRALETGNTTLQAEIVAKKETLRNITDINIDSVTTRDELIALWPEDILGTNPFPKNS